VLLLSTLPPRPHGGVVAEAIRQMARDLRAYDQARVGDVDEALDRTVEWLANRLGRCPTAAEAARAAGLDVEDVLDTLEAARGRVATDRPGALEREALVLRCRESLDRAAAAERLGTCRFEVSRLLRNALPT
jgi:DNA-directed RNA polymerase specialized sigma subunit